MYGHRFPLCIIKQNISKSLFLLQAIKESVNDDAEKGPEVETEDDDEGQDDHEMEAKWRSSERDVAHAVLGLVKTAQICAKKTHEVSV